MSGDMKFLKNLTHEYGAPIIKENIPGFVHTKASGMATGLTSCQFCPIESSGCREKNTEHHFKLQ